MDEHQAARPRRSAGARAIDLAIDRRELVAAIQGGEPATGAFATTYPFAGKEVRPFDPRRRRPLLDQAGWRLEADGKRRKDGRTLDLVLVAYPQRPELVTMQPVIRARLAALGLNPQTRVVEQASAVAAARDFDLLLWAQHTAPAGDPGFFLNAFFRTGAGNNYAGYSSPAPTPCSTASPRPKRRPTARRSRPKSIACSSRTRRCRSW